MSNRKTFLSIVFGIVLFSAAILLPYRASALADYEKLRLKPDHMQYLEYVYEYLQRNYVDPVDPEILYKGALEGMLNSLEDPYTSYISSDTLLGKDLKDTTEGSFGGIGVTITKRSISTPENPAYVEVTAPIEGTPGWKAGLQPGDFITEIDGTRTDGITQEEVLNILRGPAGTEVTIKVLRGKSLEFPLTITRAIIEVPTVKYGKIENGIGYVRLIGFNPNSAPRIREALNDLQNKNCNRFILDLRNNPGGLIKSAVDVASIFLPSGIVTYTKSRVESQNFIYNVDDKAEKLSEDIPLIILINGGSASASEIVSGALKDYKRAYLIGEKTFGKGLVQQIIPLSKKDSFKFTVSRYYTPSNANIDKLGISPDLKIQPERFTEDEEKEVIRLLKDDVLGKFTRNKKNMSKKETEEAAEKLQKTYKIRKRPLVLMIRSEFNRHREPPVFDLDYDETLKTAVKLFNTEDIKELCRTTKTVFELQQEEKNAEDEKEKNSKTNKNPVK